MKWLSTDMIQTKVGELAWANMEGQDAEILKDAVARAVTLNEPSTVEITSLNGFRSRLWRWPIGSPDLAVCAFCLIIPAEIEKLTEREREFLELLAVGQSLKQIASQLDVSINTVHAHMRHVKDKLELDSPNEVISFAARFFHPNTKPPMGHGPRPAPSARSRQR